MYRYTTNFILLFCVFLLVNLAKAQELSFQTIDPQRITIVRDNWGVPHIKAPTNAEVAYGLAWAHAEDDFASMQEMYALGTGNLARLKGAKAAPADFLQKLLRIDVLVETQYETAISNEFKQYLDGFCQGLNAFAKAHPQEVRLKKLFPLTPKSILKGYTTSICLLSGIDKQLQKVMKPKQKIDTIPVANGSNAFAISSSKTANGSALLIANPHQPLEGTMAFWEAHLVSDEGMNIHGGLFPGGVSIFLGTNENLGWAHTANHIDKVDMYKLEMKNKLSRNYKIDGEWFRLEKNEAKIKIKGIPFKVKKKIFWSKYGATVKTKSGFYAVKLFGNEDIRAAEQWWRMGFAKNFSEFQKTLQMQAIPVMNMMYADRYDTTFFIHHSVLPDRKTGYNWQRILPGNTSATMIKNYLPVSACPQILNPKSGYLYNVNHSPFLATAPADCPSKADYRCREMNFDNKHNNRSERFEELWATEGQTQITMGCLREIRNDRHYPKHSAFMNNVDAMRHLDTKKYPEIKPLIDELRAWDGSVDTANTGVTVFYLACIPIFKRYNNTMKLFENDLHLTEEQAVSSLEYAKKHLETHFKTTHLPYGKMMRLARGNKNYPLGLSTDILASMYGTMQKDGTLHAVRGDDFILYSEFDKTKKYPTISSLKAFGESARAESPHFNDQMEIFIQQNPKPMSLDWAEVLQWAKKIYHPVDNKLF